MNETWGVLELLGHRRLAGIIREESVAGVGMIRIDIPGEEGRMTTQFYAPGALYCLTPCDEATARAFAIEHQPQPIQRWELAALPERTTDRGEQYAVMAERDDWYEDDGEAEQPELIELAPDSQCMTGYNVLE